MPKEVKHLHQTLHGYRDGHRLLASSYTLSKEAERTMLALSDLSGHNIKKGFEEYITGYPLKNDGLFVLAKTWYAPEMPRPGCVWTHSILIDFATLAQIDDLRSVYNFLTKPTEQDHYDRYKIQLPFPKSNHQDGVYQSHKVLPLLKGLYEPPFWPVIVISDDALSYDDSVIAIWSQQWPKLRRSFTFCTGAIVPRKLDENLLDVQIVHSSSLAEVRSRYKEALIIDKTDNLEMNPVLDEWLYLANDDLCQKEKTKLRKFLYEFGGEFDNGKRAFSKLLKAYLVLQDQASGGLFSTYERIANLFPKANEGKALKKALIEQRERAIEWLGEKWDVAAVADFILTSENASSYQAGNKLIESVILQAWNEAPNQLVASLKLLGHDSELWDISINTLFPVIKISDLALCREISDNFFKSVLSQKPEFLNSPATWLNEPELSEFFKELTVKYIKNAPEQFDHVAKNALNHHASETIWGLYRINAKKMILALFDALQDNNFQNENDAQTTGIIKENIELALAVIHDKRIENIKVLSLAYECIPTYDVGLLSLYPEIWRPLLDNIKAHNLKKNILSKSCVQWLLVGLATSSGVGEKLVELTFSKVHQKLIDKKLNEKEISLLQKHLDAPVFMFSFWFTDKTKYERLAESLRQVLVSKFIKNGWNREIAKEIISHKETRAFFKKTLIHGQDEYDLVSDALE